MTYFRTYAGRLLCAFLLSFVVLVFASCEKVFIPAEGYVPKKVLSAEETASIQDSVCHVINGNLAFIKAFVDAGDAGLQIADANFSENGDVTVWNVAFTDNTTASLSVNWYSEHNPVPVPVISARSEDGIWYWTLGCEVMTDPSGNPVRVGGNGCPQVLVLDGQYFFRCETTCFAIEPASAWTYINPFSSIYRSESERIVVWLRNGSVLSVDQKGADCFVKYDVVQQAETNGTPLNIVVMGDGYTQDLIDDGTYDADMNHVIETFFDIEPYTSLRNLFNCYSVQLMSQTGLFAEAKRTALSCGYNGNGMRGRLDKAFGYALRIPEIASMQEGDPMNIICDESSYMNLRHIKGGLIVIVMMNSRSNQRSGICHLLGDGMCVCVVDREPSEKDFRFAVWHEAGGHGFASLADEYQHRNETASESFSESIRSAHEKGFYLNVDTTGDPAKVIWKHLLTDPRYSIETGTYEGGYLYNHGVWRPSQNSVMRYRDDYTPPYFNAVGREVIYKTAMRLNKGEGYIYNFEDFAAFDEPFRTYIQKYKPL